MNKNGGEYHVSKDCYFSYRQDKKDFGLLHVDLFNLNKVVIDTISLRNYEPFSVAAMQTRVLVHFLNKVDTGMFKQKIKLLTNNN